MKIASIIFALTLLFSVNVFSQKMTTEEFMKKYYEKTGMDKYNKIKTMIIEGENQILKDYYPFRLHFKAPNYYRLKERFKSDYTHKIISGDFRKTVGSDDRSMDMSQVEVDLIVNVVNFLEGFITNYKTNGFKIEYQGLDTVNKKTAFNKPVQGEEIIPPPMGIFKQEPLDISKMKIDTLFTAITHRIKVTTPQEKEYIMKLDTNTMNILWSSGNPFVFADIAPIRFNLYERFGDISLPIHIQVESQYMPIIIRISDIKLNEEIPDTYFDYKSEINKVYKEQ